MALIGKNLESARIIKKCSNEMICATKWNFRSCFEKVYRSYWSPFISVAKEGAGRFGIWTTKTYLKHLLRRYDWCLGLIDSAKNLH